jgi:hypothetical protein
MVLQNSDIETRNSKQIRMSNKKMTKTNTLHLRLVGHSFGVGHCLGFRNSDFEFLIRLGFSVKLITEQ